MVLRRGRPRNFQKGKDGGERRLDRKAERKEENDRL